MSLPAPEETAVADEPIEAVPARAVGASLASDPLALLSVLAFVAMFVVYAVPLLAPATLELITNRWGALFFQLLAILAIVVGRRPGLSNEERDLWRYLCLAVVGWTLAQVAWVLLPQSAAVSIGVDTLFSVSYVVVILAVEQAPHRLRDLATQPSRSYTFAATSVFGVGLAVYFALVPALSGGDAYHTVVPSMLLFLTFDLYLVVRLFQFLGEARSRRWRLVYGGLCAFASAILVGDGLEALYFAGDREWTSSPLDLVWFFPYVALALTARARLVPFDDQVAGPDPDGAVRLPKEQLVLLLVMFPAIHLVGYRFFGFDPAVQSARESVVLMVLALLGALTFGHHRQVVRGASWWVAESNRRAEALRQREELIEALTVGREAQAALRVSEEKFERAFKASPDSMVITAIDGTLLEVNEGFERITGFSRDEAIGRTTLELGLWARPEDREDYLAALNRDGRLRGREFVFRQRSGGVVVTSLSAEPIEIEGEPCFLSVVRDITESKRATEALRASEERFHKAFRSSPDAIVISDLEDGTVLEVNPSFERMSGWRRDEVLGRTSTDLDFYVHIEERALFKRNLQQLGQIRDVEFEMRTKAGEVRQTLLSAELIEIEDRPRALAIIRDVSEARAAEQALRASEQRFSSAFFSNPDPSALTTLRGGVFIEVNDAFVEASGYERDEIIGRSGHAMGLWTRESAAMVAEKIANREQVRDHEIEFVTKSGDALNHLVSSVAVDIEGEQCTLTVARDITERRVLERQLLRAQRMDSIGTLAGGIAHDLNNVLSPILMSVQLLKREDLTPQGARLLEILEANTRRGAEMIRQVLSFARGVEGDHTELNPKHLARDLETIVRDTFPKSMRAEFQVARDAAPVSGDATQLHQVLLNLALNARDAMARDGLLTVSVDNRRVDEEFCRTELDARPGAFVAFSIADDGEGIPAEIRERIFEPFFTTKSVGEGTGIGLSTVMGIVKSHEGFVTVKSEEGVGSRFTVYLPAVESEEPEPARTTSEELPIGRGEVVLLVDDEEAVREVAADTLSAYGYEVEVAEGGDEAIQIFARRADEISVVVIDMMMPGLDGPGTIEAIRGMKVDVRIVGASGLSSREDVESLGVRAFLQKPFTAEALLTAVSRVIRSEDGP